MDWSAVRSDVWRSVRALGDAVPSGWLGRVGVIVVGLAVAYGVGAMLLGAISAFGGPSPVSSGDRRYGVDDAWILGVGVLVPAVLFVGGAWVSAALRERRDWRMVRDRTL